jgi:hypothetical protein
MNRQPPLSPPKRYTIKRVATRPLEPVSWTSPYWNDIAPVLLESCRPESSTHHPHVRARLAHNGSEVIGVFDVEDRFVRCVQMDFQGEVWKDSCVEIFLRPPGDRYFNFEFNCAGAMRCSHRRVDLASPGVLLTPQQGARIGVFPSLAGPIEPEREEPVRWQLGFRLPLVIFEECLDAPLTLSGNRWKGNLYKCADESSHPHWISWSPVPEVNFHLPDYFGDLEFA